MPAETSPNTAKAVKVMFTNGFSRRYTNGIREFEVQAKTIRGVIRAMNDLFPGLGESLEEETSIAIDGVIHEVDYTQLVQPGSEVFFIPRIEGG